MSISRRAFFRLGVGRVADSVCSVVESSRRGAPARPVIRPPGALPEARFLTACTRCDECVRACPKYSIRKAGSELGERVAGTPIVLPATNPCWLCEDLPCIAACESGALVPVADRGQVRMGRATVEATRCFAAAGSICEVCQERCPVRPRAISVTFGAVPEVHEDRCTGCGVCAYLCPAGAVEIGAAG